MRREKLALYGVVLICFGLVMYALGVLLAVPRRLIFPHSLEFLAFNESLVWYSGFPLLLGLALILVDLFVLYPEKRVNEFIKNDPVQNRKVTVVLTAYNDELSIGAAVKDFLSHPLTERVIVISNNSKDNTLGVAEAAGAMAYNETLQGYGACVHRALTEGAKYHYLDVR